MILRQERPGSVIHTTGRGTHTNSERPIAILLHTGTTCTMTLTNTTEPSPDCLVGGVQSVRHRPCAAPGNAITKRDPGG